MVRFQLGRFLPDFTATDSSAFSCEVPDYNRVT